MNLGTYLLEPASTLEPFAQATILVSILLIIGGIGLLVLPGEWQKAHADKKDAFSGKAGPKERYLRTELRLKAGTSIIAWGSALILAQVLRLLGTPGLGTRFLSTLVLFAFPLLLLYFLLYRFALYPHYRKVSRLVDANQKYEAARKQKKKITGKAKINLIPTLALILLMAAPLVYYVTVAFFAIPPGVSPQNHDHLLHQFGMPVFALLGYALGLTASLGGEARMMSRLLAGLQKPVQPLPR